MSIHQKLESLKNIELDYPESLDSKVFSAVSSLKLPPQKSIPKFLKPLMISLSSAAVAIGAIVFVGYQISLFFKDMSLSSDANNPYFTPEVNIPAGYSPLLGNKPSLSTPINLSGSGDETINIGNLYYLINASNETEDFDIVFSFGYENLSEGLYSFEKITLQLETTTANIIGLSNQEIDDFVADTYRVNGATETLPASTTFSIKNNENTKSFNFVKIRFEVSIHSEDLELNDKIDGELEFVVMFSHDTFSL